jgi:predicted HTH transcriptional regulator
VIEKARLSCFNRGHRIEDHFGDVNEMIENGNPKPELKEITGAFVVKFTRHPASEGRSGGISEGISEGANGGAIEGINRLLEFIREKPGKRVFEIATALNVPSKTIERWIKKLREQEKIVFTGSRKTGGYFVNG